MSSTPAAARPRAPSPRSPSPAPPPLRPGAPGPGPGPGTTPGARPRSVAIVVPELLPVPAVQGGAIEHWVDLVAPRLARASRRLAIVSRPAGVAGDPGIEYIAIPWTPIERGFRRLKDMVTWRNPLRYLAKAQNVASYGRRVARAIDGFEIVYVHNDPNLLRLIPRGPRRRVVLHMHNDHLSQPLLRRFYHRALAGADRVLCVSDYVRRSAIARFPEHAERFSVVLNATDPQVFRPYGDEARAAVGELIGLEAGCRYLLYVGRLVPDKGAHRLVEAFGAIHARDPSTRLIITGSSFFGNAAGTAYQRELARIAGPVAAAIRFTGFVPHAQLKYLYSVADLVVVPSIWQDPCPLVVLEAMAAGTCVIATRVGGIPEMVDDGETGVLVEPDGAAALARAAGSLLAEPARRAAIGAAARRKVVAGYTWERVAGDVERVLQSL